MFNRIYSGVLTRRDEVTSELKCQPQLSVSILCQANNDNDWGIFAPFAFFTWPQQRVMEVQWACQASLYATKQRVVKDIHRLEHSTPFLVRRVEWGHMCDPVVQTMNLHKAIGDTQSDFSPDNWGRSTFYYAIREMFPKHLATSFSPLLGGVESRICAHFNRGYPRLQVYPQ